jgi:hypothetical protein
MNRGERLSPNTKQHFGPHMYTMFDLILEVTIDNLEYTCRSFIVRNLWSKLNFAKSQTLWELIK